MATKKQELDAANRGEGCLGKAGDDEPVFVLRAQDKYAPMLIELWAHLVDLHSQTPEFLGGRTSKTLEATRLASYMREWQKQTGRAKVPD